MSPGGGGRRRCPAGSRGATSRSVTMPRSATAERSRWSPVTGRSIGCACPTSIRPACSRRSWTPIAGGRFALAPEIPAEVQRRYLPDTNVLETTFTTGQGVVRVTDAMALPSHEPGADARADPASRRRRRAGPDVLARDARLRLRRLADATRAPRAASRSRSAARDALAVCSWDAGEAQIEEDAIFGRFALDESESALIALCGAHQEPLVFPTREQVEGRLQATTAYWRALGLATRLRGPVARRRDPQRAGAQAALPRSLRGDRGSGHGVAARGDRRRAQLGLPLLLGARLGLHARGAPASGLPGGGRGVLLVAAARVPAHPPAPAGPLPPRRRRARARAHARAGRLPRVAPGPGRQRRRGADPARRLRRPAADRSDLRGGGRAGRPRDRPPARRDRRPRLPHLAPTRLRHLGGPQRGAALHPFEDDVLGGARPRCSPERRRPRSLGACGDVAARGARDPRVHRDALLVAATGQLRPSRRRRGARRQRAARGAARLRRRGSRHGWRRR